MTVQPDDFNDHADRISSSHNDEIARRCAISRKYYYAFHYVRENGQSHPSANFQFGPGDHGRAKGLLKDIGQKQLANLLFKLHKRRKEADYDIGKNIEEKDLNKMESDLNKFINQVRYVL